MIKSVKIGAMTYTINLVENLQTVDDDGETKDLHGQLWQDKLQIDVKADQDEQMQAATVLHESLHGILNHAGHDHAEPLIISLGFGLFQFIRDNPDLIDWIMQVGNRRTFLESDIYSNPIMEKILGVKPIQSNGGEE